MSIFDDYRKKNKEEEDKKQTSFNSFRGQNEATQNLFKSKGAAENNDSARTQIRTIDNIRKYRENNIAQRDFEQREQEYMASLPNDEYRRAYTSSKDTGGMYVSPYFSKGIEGKEKLKYNNDDWNSLSEAQRKKYLEWAQEELDKESQKTRPDLKRDNKYLEYAMNILNETNQDVRTMGDTHNLTSRLFKAVVPDKLENALGMNKEKVSTFDSDSEMQMMLQMLPENIRQTLLNGYQLSENSPTRNELRQYYSDEMIDKLVAYGNKVGNIYKQQERNETEEELMKNPFYATVVAPAKQIGYDLAVKPIAGAIDLVESSKALNQGIYGEYDPLRTEAQKMAQDARYINESINSGLGAGGQFVYGTAVSGAESAIRMYMANAGGAMLSRTMPFINAEAASKTLLTGMMSTAVFNDDLNENIQKGMPLEDAIGSAVAHSIFESLFEEISLDKLGYFQEAPVLKSKGAFVKQLLKAGVVEGSEEAFTDIANELYDHYVGNYDYSEYKAFKDNYLQKNPDANDAEVWKHFLATFGWQVAQSFAGGALSSFALSSTKGMDALRRGEAYIQNGQNVSDADYTRMLEFVTEMAAVNPSIRNQLAEAEEGGEIAKRGFVKMVADEYSSRFDSEIENAKTKDNLNIVMNNATAALNGAISEDTFNKYNAKLVELGESPADYKTFVQNRQKMGNTTFSELAYGRGDNAISRNIVEASKSIADTKQNANLSESERETTIKQNQEKIEQNVKKAEEMVARYAQMGVALDSPEVRQFESVLGLQNMAQLYSAGKISSENNMLSSVGKKSGTIKSINLKAKNTIAVLGKEAMSHVQAVPFAELKNSTEYTMAKALVSMTGANVEFYKSDRNTAVKNGAYDPRTNTFYFDSNAGVSGTRAAIGEVFSHELTHWMRANNEEGYQRLLDFVRSDVEGFDSLMKDKIARMKENGIEMDENVAQEELVAEACQRMLENSDTFKKYAAMDEEGAKTILQRLIDFIRKLRDAFKGSLNNEITGLVNDLEGLQQTWETALQEAIGEIPAEAATGIIEGNTEVAEQIVGTDLVTDDSVRDSQRLNSKLMKDAESEWKKVGKDLGISYQDFYNTMALCNQVANRMLTDLAPYLPEDNPGKVEVGNASYGRSMENALVCIRSIINNDFTDMVSEELGRPLTVEEQLVASQVLQLINERPECNYCYVATDRRAYRAAFGTYFKQYQQVYDTVASNREAFKNDLPGAEKKMEAVKVDTGEKNRGNGVIAQAYADFLNGRKNTPDMRKRFLGWLKSAVSGEMPISQKDLTSARVRNKAKDDDAKKWFIYDAENYAQKATWAKKTSRTLKINGERYVLDYVSYNGSILKWKDPLIKQLNSEFGLRMYSFSDYVPAFLLENMQMIVDASLRGLKVLAYTKDCGFAEAFADTGAGINISIFGTLSAKANNDTELNALREQYKKTNSDSDRKAYLAALDKYVVKDGINGKDGMMGANWERAVSLRKTYDNVGTVFVATNDDLVEWALANPEIDVVIPYHLVRTGEEVASFFNYKNYKAAQEDKKNKGWNSSNKKAISPVVHENSFEKYMQALKDNNLTARFSDFVDNPNYMKLVNETRMSYNDLQPVQPRFNQSIINRELGRIKTEGQYGTIPGFQTKADQDAFFENQNLIGQAVDAIRDWNETGKKPIDDGIRASERTASELDSEYMAAVESGDTETADMMVREAAIEAGYTSEKLYHGTSAFGFTEIDKKELKDHISFFATDSESVASTYSGTKNARAIADNGSNLGIYQLYANTDGMLELDAKGADSGHIELGKITKQFNDYYNPNRWNAYATARQIAKFAKANGYTGVIIRNLIDTATPETRDNSHLSSVYAFFDAKAQVKSADTVTYGSDGNIIPLSERFNKDSSDIRYSSRDSSGRELTEAQQEYFKDSKARDKDGNLLRLYHGSVVNNINVFNVEKTENTSGGIFMSTDRVTANNYTGDENTFSRNFRTKDHLANLYPMYANLVNPLIVDAMNRETEKYDVEIAYDRRAEKYNIRLINENGSKYKAVYRRDVLVDMFGEKTTEQIERNINKKIDSYKGNDFYKDFEYKLKGKIVTLSEPSIFSDIMFEGELVGTDDLVEIAKERGYDGLIVYNVIDDLSFSDYGSAATDVVAFSPEQVKLIDNENPTSSDDIRFSSRDSGKSMAELDEEYENAYNDYDDARMQEIVDAAAEKAGYKYKAFHHTESSFTVFDLSKARRSMDIQGFFFSADPEAEREYGSKRYDVYLKMNNPYIVDGKESAGRIPFDMSKEDAGVTAREWLIENGYDSVIRKADYYGAEADEYVVLDSNQIKSADAMTFDDNDNLIMPSERFNDYENDIRFSYRDLANSESEILVNMLKYDEQTGFENLPTQALQAYAKAYNELKEMEKQSIEYSKQLSKKGTTPSEREAILRKQVRLDRAILNKTTELTEMRNKRVIRDLLISEWDKRDTLIAAGKAEERFQTRQVLEEKYGKELESLKAKNKAKQTEIRNRHEINKRKNNIIKKTKELMNMIQHPTEKKHIPSILVNPIVELLDGIDYWTPAEGRPVTKKSESFRNRFENFRSAINEYQKQIDEGTEQIELMFDPEFLETVDDLCASVKDIDNVNDMSVQDIIDLDHTLTELQHLISRGNKMIKAYHYKTIEEAVNATDETMKNLKTLSDKTNAKGNLRMRLNAGMADSYAFGRYAGNGTEQIIDGLSKAFEDKVSKVKQAVEFTQKVLEPYKKELKSWSKDTHEFTLSTTDRNGNPNKVKLTVGQMMELYLLNKREQARGHIYGGGIRVEDRKGRYTESVKVTEEDVQNILNYLSTVPGAMEVADKLQQYGATTITGWGNEASNLLYGYAKFLDENYWQIRSDNAALKDNENTEKAVNASMYRLQNLGRTKAVKKGANNAIYVGDVFDTWSKTIDEMTSYASILPATSDAMRWWNSRIVNEDGDAVRVKKLLESKLGTDMTKVFTETIKALNGGIMGTDSLESLVKTLTGKSKAAAVAGNLRVVLQQPTAYTRAAAVIEPKYLLKALTMKPAAEEAQEHSAIAWHKAQGFYSNGLAPSLRKLVIGDASIGENLTEKSLWLAGKADDITWGALWNASKLKVEEENKVLKKGSEEYWNEVNKVFSDIINNTQVVDTPLTKSTWMRGNGLGVFFTAFMAEPTKTYSMVMTSFENLLRDPKSPAARKAFAGVLTVFGVNAAVNAMAQALADAARDDDKELSYWEKYVKKYTEDIKDNLNPLTYIPVVKDVWSLWNGYSNTNLALQAPQNVIYAVQEIQKVAQGKSKKTLFGQMETIAKAISSCTGIPVGNVMRTFNSFGNVAGIDIFRRKKYTKSELGRNVVLSIKEGNTAEATEYWNQLVLEVGEDDISEAYGYISTYLAEHDENVDAYAVAFLEDANNLETQAEDLMRKYEYNEYITLDVCTDAIRKAAREDQKAEAEANKTKYKQTVSSTNSGGTIYNSSDVNRALEKGKIDEAQKIIDKINAGYKSQGSNSTAKSAVSNYWKPKYLAASGSERDAIAKMLYKLKNNGKQMFSAKDLQKWVSDANKKK